MDQKTTNQNKEYADLILWDIQLHATPARKPKEWYPELLRASKRHASTCIYTSHQRVLTAEDGRIGLELKFPISKEVAEKYYEAMRTGTKFKLFTPKDGIRIYPDKNMLERIKAFNKRAGFQYLKGGECRGQLSTFAIDGGTAIIKVFLV